ncbi:Zn(2)-C6 fungal-type DNA-binding domain protein, partial [Metarhizium hybridum]
MDLTLRNPELDNEDGACWTCLSHKRKCDRMLPKCRACHERGVKCSGYGVRISWPKDIWAPKQQRRHKQRASGSLAQGSLPADAVRLDRHALPSSISTLTLPTTESFYMQHFLRNIARIALAIDHDDNGYRSLLPMALTEPCVLNAALAVAASHHSRWQRIPDTMSRKYLRAACKAVRDRFTDPRLIKSPATLAAMLLLVSYEVFSGSSRWKGHHTAIRGWIQGRRDCSDIDSFLKNWVCLIDTQNALNLGTSTIPEVEEWMGAASSDRGYTVDALFGCSARLPRLMAAASRLYVASKQAEISEDWVRSQAESLQTRIRSTRLQDNSQIMIGLSCNDTPQEFSVTVGVDREELRRRAGATAEIFRHAAHIYVHRIAHAPMEALTPETQESLETALQLLTQVPDALGPGANLGWCLVVLGAELDIAEQREYINSRWDGLHLLGIDNTRNGQKILDEVWNHRDLVRRGFATPERWQDTMQRIGQSQILV